MKAILLAAGRGSRMGDHTAHQPKCFTELAGQTLLSWQLEALTAAGIQEIAIVSGYCHEQLEVSGYRTFHNPRWAETNMVASLCCAEAWLEDGPCLVSYSDIVYHPQVIRQLIAASGNVAISYDTQWEALWKLRFCDVLSDAESFRLNEQGQLVEIGQKASQIADIQGQYMGLLCITPQGWSGIRRILEALPETMQAKLDMTSLLQQLLQQGESIQAIPVKGQWCEVDNGHDVLQYETMLSQTTSWEHDWRWKQHVLQARE